MSVRGRTGRGGRRVAVAVLVVQLLLTAALPLADAGLEASAPRSGVVVSEAGSGAPGQRPHDHMACQFCRLLGQDALMAAGAVRAAVGGEPTPPPAPSTLEALAPTTPAFPLGSRAPPRV
jgi:hypothetical protein